MDERLDAAVALLGQYGAQHVLLSAAALAFGVALSLPLAIMAARKARLRWVLLTLASLVQTIPGLALLALFYPLLLGVSALTERLTGAAVPALGFLPSLLALTIYSMLPILRNGVTAMLGIDPAFLEAADGVGMTHRQKLFRVELPLAAPVIMAGIRTAAVWTIGMATLSTTVGQTSLGNLIFSGLQTENWISVLVGCGAVAVLALVVDQCLALIETAAVRREPLRLAAGVAVLVFGTGVAAATLWRPAATYVIGAKNFSEQFILATLMSQRIEATDHKVMLKDGLGSAVVFRALASGDIDAYVDYSGTLWTNVLDRHDTPPRDVMLRELTHLLREQFGVTLLGALGFENAYALAMRSERSAGLRTISDLAPLTPRLTLGSDLEFLSRPEWRSLKESYGLAFAQEKAFSPTFMYRALAEGSVDVISAFSSDGRIAAENLKVLIDDKHAIPAYDAVILISPQRRNDALLRQALAPLIGAISVEAMRQANYMLDRDTDKASVQQAARFLAEAIHLPAKAEGPDGSQL
jgi:osmoprotectant transport system permease protein